MRCEACGAENSDGARACSDCGADLNAGAGDSSTLEAPAQGGSEELLFGRYRMVEELGSGGMGRLLRVLDAKINEQIAHRLGVVHRDLKPRNIQIEPGGQARIMDFGLARSSDIDSKTVVGTMLGTPHYMSPEQVDGLQADHRADIYSFGVMLFEMVAGCRRALNLKS